MDAQVFMYAFDLLELDGEDFRRAGKGYNLIARRDPAGGSRLLAAELGARRLVGISLVIGLAGAFAATRLLNSLLFGVGASDPGTFIGIVLLVSAVAFIAAWVRVRTMSSRKNEAMNNATTRVASIPPLQNRTRCFR